MGTKKEFFSGRKVIVDLVGDPKRIPYVTCRMISWNIEFVEIVLFGFDLWPIFYFKTK